MHGKYVERFDSSIRDTYIYKRVSRGGKLLEDPDTRLKLFLAANFFDNFRDTVSNIVDSLHGSTICSNSIILPPRKRMGEKEIAKYRVNARSLGETTIVTALETNTKGGISMTISLLTQVCAASTLIPKHSLPVLIKLNTPLRLISRM